MEVFEIHNQDCLVALKAMPDNSVDSIVTDPPYGLTTNSGGPSNKGQDSPHGRSQAGASRGGFMGMKWDSDVPPVDVWVECLRVLKPGGHLLAFAGTRTQHRMATRIEDAGFEIRDMIAWVYGCLSEDSEVLTEDGWMPYNRAKQKNILAYDLQNDIYQWERPSRWNEYRVESDTAYRIQSDHTDQIVSRGHRCIVERGGVLEFVPSDELAGVERVPYLRGDISALPQGRGELLLQAVLREGKGLAQETLSERQGEEAPRQGACWREKSRMERRSDLFQAQGEVPGSVDQVRALPCGTDEHGAQGRVCDGASPCCSDGNWQATDADGVRAPHQPRRDGQQTGEPDAVCDECGSQAVRARPSYQTTVATVTAIEYSGLIWCPTVSTGAFVARRNGKVFITGNSGFPKSLDVSKAIDKANGKHERDMQPFGDYVKTCRDAKGWTLRQLDEAMGTNTAASWWEGRKAGVQPPSLEQYRKLKCVLGMDGRFDDLIEWLEAERDVVGQQTKARSTSGASALPTMGGQTVYQSWDITAPATEAAKQWDGWGTALKPALEPITVARKPIAGTVAANVLEWGTGALNIDGCRVGDSKDVPASVSRAAAGNSLSGSADGSLRRETGQESGHNPNIGRWPANLIHDGSEDVLQAFPQAPGQKASVTGAEPSNTVRTIYEGLAGDRAPMSPRTDTGSAARFFYCPKASRADRNEGLEDPGPQFKKGSTLRDAENLNATGDRKGNHHPTVKPTDLMAYLCRLVTPPGGIVLDPFMGSGSTGKAAIREGFKFIGIDMDPDYVKIARARIEYEVKRKDDKLIKNPQFDLFEGAA